MHNFRPDQRDAAALVVLADAFAGARPADAAPDDEIVALDHFAKIWTIENSLARWRAEILGELEGWRAGVLERQRRVRPFRYSNTPLLHHSTARQMITEATIPVRSASKPAGMACRVCFTPTAPK